MIVWSNEMQIYVKEKAPSAWSMSYLTYVVASTVFRFKM